MCYKSSLLAKGVMKHYILNCNIKKLEKKTI